MPIGLPHARFFVDLYQILPKLLRHDGLSASALPHLQNGKQQQKEKGKCGNYGDDVHRFSQISAELRVTQFF